MIQEDIDRLKQSGFKVERTPTGYVFTLEQRDKFGDLYAGKEECEVIQKIGKIVDMRVVRGTQLRIVVFRAIIGTG
ncbi:MAG: hypothetical protein M3Y53_10220 [Thermoproteota archaeon]|nr:hypothetical protein [Thermoproteota archaeon]